MSYVSELVVVLTFLSHTLHTPVGVANISVGGISYRGQ